MADDDTKTGGFGRPQENSTTIFDTQNTDVPPSVQGETSVSGGDPDPESDDDTLQNAKDVGLQLDADDEHPKELNIAKDIDDAEKYKHTH